MKAGGHHLRVNNYKPLPPIDKTIDHSSELSKSLSLKGLEPATITDSILG